MKPEKINWNALGLVTALLVLPFVVLAFFAQPSADDFAYIRKALDRGYLGALAYDWQTWNGRYSSNFLVLANPFQKGLVLYKGIIALLIAITPIIIQWCIQPLISDRKHRWLLSLWLTTAYFATVPTIAEALYWYTGIVTYHLGILLALVSWRLLAKTKWRWLGILVTFIGMGMSEIQAISASLLLLTGFLPKKYRLTTLPKWAIFGAITGAVLLLISPGNSGRSAEFSDNWNWLHSTGMGLLQTGRFLLSWTLTPYLWFVVLALVVMPLNLSKSFTTYLQEKPIWYFPLAIVILTFIGCWMPYLGTGILGQHRTLIIPSFCFVGGLTMWLLQLRERVLQKLPWLGWSMNHLPVLLFFSMLFPGNGYTTALALVSGQALDYDDEQTARLEQCKNHPNEDISFPPPQHRPVALFNLDLTPDSTHWINQNYAIVNGVRTVVISQ